MTIFARIRSMLYSKDTSALHMDLKQRFLKIYSTLPLGVRKEIVVVLDPPVGPVSWEAANIEVENDTRAADTILEKLVQIQAI